MTDQKEWLIRKDDIGMKRLRILILTACIGGAMLFSGCAGEEKKDTDTETAAEEQIAEKENDKVASSEEMSEVIDVVEEGMEPIPGSSIQDGTYEVTVDSSSTMFKIESCQLTVADGKMTALMTMGGTGYLYLYMGTGEEAAEASEDDYISFVETEEGVHTFEVPVEALDQGIDCAAFSKRKEKWYDRQLLFRADSLPTDAFSEGVLTTADSLGLADGIYTAEVELVGGSGKASVESPAKLTVEGGQVTAEIIWSSSNYDYMIVGGEKYLPMNTEGNSTFEIPAEAFDWRLPVKADTTAMSEPHEIAYTLRFDSASIEKAE